MRKLLILGAGGYGKTVADVASQLGRYQKIAFLDDGSSGPGVLGRCEAYSLFVDEDTDVYPAFGNNEVRMRWLSVLKEEGIAVPTLIHPASYVSPTAGVGTGTVILPMAVVNTGVILGDGCIVNLGAIIDHDTILEDGVHLAPGAIVKAQNRIPAMRKIESGTVVANRAYPL